MFWRDMDHGEGRESSPAPERDPVHVTRPASGTVGPGRIEPGLAGPALGRHDPARSQFIGEPPHLGLIDV